MLNPNMLETYDQLLSVEIEKLDEVFYVDMNASIGRIASRGMLQSSGAALEIVKLASQSLSTRTDLALSLAEHCAVRTGVEMKGDLANEFSERINKWIENQAEHLRRLASKSPALKWLVTEGKSDQFFAGLERTRDIAKKEVDGKFKLASLSVEAARNQAEPSSSTTFNITGPVGVLQTGAYSSATGTTVLDATSIRELKDALDMLSRAIDANSGNLPMLHDLIEDTKEELGKPLPNALKVTSAFRGIVESAKAVPALRDAYEIMAPLLIRLSGSF